jgi:hypothetical protein
MADPRTISRAGIGAQQMTFLAATGITDTNVNSGELKKPAVTVTANGTVGLGSSGGRLLGKLQTFESQDRACAVQYKGVMTFEYSGSTAPTVGASVEVDGTGKVVPATSNNVSRGNHVLSVDTTAKTVEVLIP